MNRRLIAILLVLLLPAVSAHAKPRESAQDPLILEDVSEPGDPRFLSGTSLSNSIFTDTVSYGGTWWAPDSSRWEAVRDSCWTFDSGVGSSINTGGNPNKPPGYHQTMEGWFGIDQTLFSLPYFRRSTTCAINGSFAAWAGVTLSEANSLCYGSGQGYGNSWNLFLGKSFIYPGSGNATFSYKYAVQCESGFDYAYAIIDTTGTSDPGAGTGITLASYTGVVSGTDVFVLTPGVNLPSTAGRTVNIWFNVRSDGSYSDEDGLNPTVCGHSAIDDISLTGAITDFTDFESGSNGWEQSLPTTAVGDYSDLASRANLPAPATFCPCSVTDSVLVFFDETFGHPGDQDNIAASPWINLKRPANTTDIGRPLRLMLYSVYSEMPIANYVFVQFRARYYPAICPATGLLYRTPWRDQNIVFYYGEAPFCNTVGTTQLRDYSAVIGPAAEQIQVAYGVLNLCRTAPFGFPCTGVTNTTPWLDNISLGIGGSVTSPSVTLLTFDRLQDSFSQDGTMNPGSPGRIDTNTIKDGSSPVPGTHLRDTLVVRGNGGNTEVRIYFAVKASSQTNLTSLGSRAARWTSEPGITPLPGRYGSTWYSARLDTAEQGGTPSFGNWMAAFHENDPGFRVSDRSPDPTDPNQLENEILPDRILTPNSRIDYFVASRYIPPDPRNVGGTSWTILPDTTAGRTLEMEILPHISADTTWNCILYVDHHQDRAFDEQLLEEQGLQQALGPGARPPEGTRYDRFDVETPSSGQLSFGRAIQTNYGCSYIQIFAYKTLAWHSSTLSSVQLTDEDANVIRQWLTIPEIGGNRFWGSGDGLARSMAISNETQTISFMNNILGVTAVCTTVREAGCPVGSVLDSTYCLPLAAVAGAHFPTTLPASARGNGCSALRSFDVLTRNTSVTSTAGQLNYMKNGSAASYASVTNYNTVDVDYKTVLDGFAVGSLRDLSGDPHNPPSCSSTAPAIQRSADVMNWFDTFAHACGFFYCAGCLDVPNDGGTPPALRVGLAPVFPNPMTAVSHIQFTNPASGGRVRIDIFDVTGRLVRTIADGPFSDGTHEVAWNGDRDDGRPAAAGLYFVRMKAGIFIGSKTVVLVR